MNSNIQKDGQINAVVLAGGINTRMLYPGYEPGYKALVDISGKPLIQYILDALDGSQHVGEVAIVGPEAELRPIVGSDYRIATSGDTLFESVISALSIFPESSLVALVTADLPLLQARMVDEFVQSCSATPTQYSDSLFLSVVPRQFFTGEFAACGKNFNAFRDVQICHGNLALISPSLLKNENALSRINSVYAGRKSPVASAMAIGLGLGLAYVFGVHFSHILTLPKMAEMASKRFNFGFIPVACPYPQLAIDIDEPSDYEIAQRTLTRQSTNS